MKSQKKLSLSVVMPAYNEEASLGFILENTLKDLPRFFKEYEVIVVDDGSVDSTPSIADDFAQKNKNIRVIHQPNGGFNKAMIAGINASRKDYVCCLPPNGKIFIRDMAKCFKIMENYDLVLGIRDKRYDHKNLTRLVLSYGVLLIYRILFGLSYKDVHWVYVWKTKEIKKISLDPEGAVFLLAESLIKFRRRGLKIGQAITAYRQRIGGESKAVKFRVVWKTFKSILRLWWQIVTGKL